MPVRRTGAYRHKKALDIVLLDVEKKLVERIDCDATIDKFCRHEVGKNHIIVV